MATVDKRANGRPEAWETVLRDLERLGRGGFSGQVILHVLRGRPTKYEVREVRRLTERRDSA